MLSNKIIGTCYNVASKNFITQHKYLKTPVTFPEMWTVTSWRCWYSPMPVRWRARARSWAWCPTCPTRSRARCVNEAASPPSCSRRWWPMQVRVCRCCLTSRGLRRLYVVKCWCSIWLHCFVFYAGFSHIITMDIHQKEVQGFFNCPVDNLRASPFLIQYITESVSWHSAWSLHSAVVFQHT